MSTLLSPVSPATSSSSPALLRKCDHCSGLCRTLLVRLFVLFVKRRVASYVQRWQISAIRAGNSPRGGKVTSDWKPKAVIRKKDQSGSISPTLPGKKTSMSASTLKPTARLFKKPSVMTKKDNKKQEESRTATETSLEYKRPISVPPGRPDDSTPPLTPTEAPITPNRKTERRGDVGTRLFNQAVEMETKREEKRKSMEPAYPFAPCLAHQTPKWLRQKSARPSPKARRDTSEEVAVVSSAAVFNSTLGRVGLMLGKTKPQRGPLGIDVEFASLGRDHKKEVFMNTERSPLTGCKTTKEQVSSFFESFVVARESPRFNQDAVMVDFEGEESCEVLPTFPTKV